ncbi:hypothetical protein GCM10011588_66310 [Nocardia jinanensis]|uniref:Uncharacterized protein n=1 Tax=Nocardia jinanensis TaxID=382504 RepID=A0A917RWE7_9NOCA|nr:hypothetical protein GCM10011588_66310 [Nocardia jinanensis]
MRSSPSARPGARAWSPFWSAEPVHDGSVRRVREAPTAEADRQGIRGAPIGKIGAPLYPAIGRSRIRVPFHRDVESGSGADFPRGTLRPYPGADRIVRGPGGAGAARRYVTGR